MPSSILVIEDDGAFRKELVKLLKSDGFIPKEAATGKSAPKVASGKSAPKQEKKGKG